MSGTRLDASSIPTILWCICGELSPEHHINLLTIFRPIKNLSTVLALHITNAITNFATKTLSGSKMRRPKPLPKISDFICCSTMIASISDSHTKLLKSFGVPGEARTPDPMIKSHVLYLLSYRHI